MSGRCVPDKPVGKGLTEVLSALRIEQASYCCICKTQIPRFGYVNRAPLWSAGDRNRVAVPRGQAIEERVGLPGFGGDTPKPWVLPSRFRTPSAWPWHAHADLKGSRGGRRANLNRRGGSTLATNRDRACRTARRAASPARQPRPLNEGGASGHPCIATAWCTADGGRCTMVDVLPKCDGHDATGGGPVGGGSNRGRTLPTRLKAQDRNAPRPEAGA